MAEDTTFSVFERLPKGQLAHWRTHQFRAWIRIILLAVPIIVLGLLGILLNNALFGAQAVLRWGLVLGLLPAAVAFLGFLWMSGLFVKAVFGLNTSWNGFRYAILCLFGRPLPLKYPFIVVADGEIRKGDRDKFLANRRLGGPGALIVQNNNAVVLERFGQITRVEGPGRVFLHRFERIRRIIDLRPQRRTVQAKVFTKDGLAVKAEITVRFKIKCDQEATLNVPYPIDRRTLETAARADSWRVLVGISEGPMGWIDTVMGNVESTLRGIIATRTLDQVYAPADVTVDPRDDINRMMLERLREASAKVGVEMMDVILGPIKPADPLVEEEWRAAWLAAQNARDRVELAHGRAEALLARETAYAYAQLEMMLAIDRGFQKLVEQNQKLPPYFVALRFTETLRRMAAGTGMKELLPIEAINMLEVINERLLGGLPSLDMRDSATLEPRTGYDGQDGI